MQNPLAKIEPSYKRDFILFGIPQEQQFEDIKLTIKLKASEEEYTKPQLSWELWWKNWDYDNYDSSDEEVKKTLIKLAPKLDQTAFSKNSNQTNTELPYEVKKIKHQAYL